MNTNVEEWEKTTSSLYGGIDISPCPFTADEVANLGETQEMLVYVPGAWTMRQLCDWAGFQTNIDFNHEHLIRNTMASEDHWFVTSDQPTPEMLFKSAVEAKRIYEDEGLHGMDVRRYLAFCGFYKSRHGMFPDQRYWVFLLSGSYDRSGVSIIGFDAYGVLSHHGWMRNFKAKFAGSRYAVLPPRLEITAGTAMLSRAFRGKGGGPGLEAAMDSGRMLGD